jgi:hypothetical protein
MYPLTPYLIGDLTQAFELAMGNIADIVKYREAQRLLFDSQFDDVPLTPQLPPSVTSKLTKQSKL